MHSKQIIVFRKTQFLFNSLEKLLKFRVSLDPNKDRSGCRRTDHTLKNIDLLQEKLIEDPGISARNNCLEINKNTFNRIGKRNLKCHPIRKNYK